MNVQRANQRGISAVEALVGLVVLSLVLTGFAGLLIQSSKANRAQQAATRAQAEARNSLATIVPRLRSAGWDPRGIGFDAVTLDPTPADEVSQIELRADLNDDGDLDDEFEQLVIRHRGDAIEWRTSPTGTFRVVADGITNDADGDGVPEPMFVADADPPSRIALTITARSGAADPHDGRHPTYTVRSQITLRDNR